MGYILLSLKIICTRYLSLLLKIICARHVSLSLKIIWPRCFVIAENHMRVLCRYIARAMCRCRSELYSFTLFRYCWKLSVCVRFGFHQNLYAQAMCRDRWKLYAQALCRYRKKFICTRYVSLSLKIICTRYVVLAQNYMRALCLGIAKNYLCALGLVFAKIYMCGLCVVIDENYMLKIICWKSYACAVSLHSTRYVSLSLRIIYVYYV